MANTWGGTTIPLPSVYDRSPELVGSTVIVADGSMVIDSIATKYRIRLVFDGITSTERDTILGKIAAYTSAALAIQDETSENVIAIPNTTSVSRFAGGTRAYTLSCEVRSA